MPDLAIFDSVLIRVIAAGFAVGGWVYGYKRGYSLFGTSLVGLLAVWLWIVIAALFHAFSSS